MEHKIVYGMDIVFAAEGEVPAVHSDLAVPVAGSRVGVQPLLVSEIRRPSVLDAPRPCVAITSACRMIFRVLAQAAVDHRRPSVAFSCLLPLPAFWTRRSGHH